MKKALVLLVMFAFVATFVNFAKAEDAKKDGKTIFTEAKCMSCHGISVAAIEKTNAKSKAPDLSTTGDKNTAADLAKYLVKEIKLNDKNHPIKFGGSADDLNTMSAWLGTLKTPAK
jgi:cytochrome c553